MMWKSILAALTILLFTENMLAAPLTVPIVRDIGKRASSIVPSPVFITFDKNGDSDFPTADALKGFNVFALTNYGPEGASGSAGAFANLSSTAQQNLKNEYSSAGIRLIVSLFGGNSDEQNISPTLDPKSFAQQVGSWVKKYKLDGVDVDYENFAAMSNTAPNSPDQIKFLSDLTTELRNQLPAGEYIISHSPVAWWFTTKKGVFQQQAYLTVDKNVGKLIDFYNVQFYNNGNNYGDCGSLLTKSIDTQHPGTSLFEIIKSGIDKNKLLIGKPVSKADAGQGVMDAATLNSCLAQAKKNGWNAGLMAWAWPDSTSDWISQVRGNVF